MTPYAFRLSAIPVNYRPCFPLDSVKLQQRSIFVFTDILLNTLHFFPTLTYCLRLSVFLKCFLIFRVSEPHVSYIHVSSKKKRVVDIRNPQCLCQSVENLVQSVPLVQMLLSTVEVLLVNELASYLLHIYKLSKQSALSLRSFLVRRILL